MYMYSTCFGGPVVYVCVKGVVFITELGIELLSYNYTIFYIGYIFLQILSMCIWFLAKFHCVQLNLYIPECMVVCISKAVHNIEFKTHSVHVSTECI